MTRYKMSPGETLYEAILHAGMMASVAAEPSYVICCARCGEPIADHQEFGDCEIFLRNKKELDNPQG